MSEEGNGQPVHFRLDMSGQVRQELKALAHNAIQKGVGPSVKKALQTIFRLFGRRPGILEN